MSATQGGHHSLISRGTQYLKAPLAIAGLSLLLMAGGCASAKTSDRDLELISVADAPELVDASAGMLGIGKTSGGVYVDPRTTSAFEDGHIPGAISMPFQHVRRDWELLLAYDTVIIYGDDFNDPKARGMSKRLIEFGLEDVRTLRGGLVAWEAAGLSLETGATEEDAASTK